MKKSLIIYEDDYIIVANKPPGVESQPGKGFSQDMISLLKNELNKSGVKNPYLGVVHRLDKPVQGLIVYARTEAVTAKLCTEFAERNMEKCYCAVVRGTAPADRTTVKNRLLQDRQLHKAIVLPWEDGNRTKKTNPKQDSVKKAELVFFNACGKKDEIYRPFEDILTRQGYMPVEENGKCFYSRSGSLEDAVSIVSVRLMTGRFHQIRAQLSAFGFPILGDQKYGEPMDGFETPALASVKLSFAHPVNGRRMTFSLLGGNVE